MTQHAILFFDNSCHCAMGVKAIIARIGKGVTMSYHKTEEFVGIWTIDEGRFKNVFLKDTQGHMNWALWEGIGLYL